MEQGISTKSARKYSSKVEKNKPIDTEEKTPNPVPKGGDTDPGISTKSAQNHSSKIKHPKLNHHGNRRRYLEALKNRMPN